MIEVIIVDKQASFPHGDAALSRQRERTRLRPYVRDNDEGLAVTQEIDAPKAVISC